MLEKPPVPDWIPSWLRGVYEGIQQDPMSISPNPMMVTGADRVGRQAVAGLTQKFPNLMKMADRKLPDITVSGAGIKSAEGPIAIFHNAPGRKDLWGINVPEAPVTGVVQTPESGLLSKLLEMFYFERPQGAPLSSDQFPRPRPWPVRGSIEDVYTSGTLKKATRDAYPDAIKRNPNNRTAAREEAERAAGWPDEWPFNSALHRWDKDYVNRQNWNLTDPNLEALIPNPSGSKINPPGVSRYNSPKHSFWRGPGPVENPIAELSNMLAERMLGRASKPKKPLK